MSDFCSGTPIPQEPRYFLEAIHFNDKLLYYPPHKYSRASAVSLAFH